MATPEVIIVGGGVIGCATAYFLAKSGAKVLVLERERLGSGASSAAAGMLAPLAESEKEDHLLDLGLRSLRMFPALIQAIEEESGISVEHVPSGVLRVALDEDQEELRQRFRWQQTLGLEVEWLEASQLRALEPRVSPEVRGGILSRGETHLNSRRLVEALARAAAQRGAQFKEGTEVIGLILQGRRVTGVRTWNREFYADWVVLASGAWTSPFERDLGISLGIRPVRGQLLALQMPLPFIRTPIFHKLTYLVPQADGSVILGTTVEEAGFEGNVTAEGLRSILEGALRLVPGLKGAAFLRAWMGFRPGSPDHQPLLGPVEGREGLALALGHYRNGILLSAITGELLSNYILCGDLEPLKPFSPNRFQKGKA